MTKSDKVNSFVTSITNKITSLISTHNSDTSAHSDIRNTLTNHTHGQITKDGKISSDISSVNKIVVTDGSTIIRTISKLPADKVTHQDISGKANSSDLSTVATTGDYDDLNNKPTILSITVISNTNEINSDGIYFLKEEVE